MNLKYLILPILAASLLLTISQLGKVDAEAITKDHPITSPITPIANKAPKLKILDPDVNNDGVVNINDVRLVVSVFGSIKGDSKYKQKLDLDNSGRILGADVSIVTNASGLNWPPSNLQLGKKLVFYIAGSDEDGDALTYSASNLPDGAAFNTTSGRFEWTPIAGQTGTFIVTFRVSDGKRNDSKRLPISILSNSASYTYPTPPIYTTPYNTPSYGTPSYNTPYRP